MLFSYTLAEKHFLVEKQLAKCQELSAVKYQYEDIAVKEISSNLWLLVPAYRTERLLVKISVNVRAGIKDTGDIWFFLNESDSNRHPSIKEQIVSLLPQNADGFTGCISSWLLGNGASRADGEHHTPAASKISPPSVLVVIPKCAILESGISKQEPLLEARNFKTNISLDDMFKEINSKHIEIVGQTIQDGILLSAAEHSRAIITSLLKTAGFETVTVLCDGIDKENEASVAAYRAQAEQFAKIDSAKEKASGGHPMPDAPNKSARGIIGHLPFLKSKKTNAEGSSNPPAVSSEMDETAKRQYSTALYRLGRALLLGEGTTQDISRGVQYLKDAADMGNANAWHELALCYLHGTGMEKDETSAMQCLKKAVDAQCNIAFYDAALCYFYGRGCEKDEHTAFELFQKAAESGDEVSRLWLGLYYLLGMGNVDIDEYKAIGYIRPAATGGDACAMTWIALCQLDGLDAYKNTAAKDRQEAAASFLRQAAEKDFKDAFFPLALCYADGAGVKKDYVKALRWLEKAVSEGAGSAWQGDARAALGMFYRNGWGMAEKSGKKAALFGYKENAPILHTDGLLAIRRERQGSF